MMGIIAENVLCDLKDHRQHGLIKQRHSREINNQSTCHDGAIFKNVPASSEDF